MKAPSKLAAGGAVVDEALHKGIYGVASLLKHGSMSSEAHISANI